MSDNEPEVEVTTEWRDANGQQSAAARLLHPLRGKTVNHGSVTLGLCRECDPHPQADSDGAETVRVREFENSAGFEILSPGDD